MNNEQGLFDICRACLHGCRLSDMEIYRKTAFAVSFRVEKRGLVG